MLEVDALHAYYGKSHILQGISFRVGEGEIISLLGRNGAGRSTTIKTIMGQVRPVGAIRFKGERIDGLKPHEIARGLGYVPEDREIFPELTVRENLMLGVKSPGRNGQRARWSFETPSRCFRCCANARCAGWCPVRASSRCLPSAAR
jgi:branched-chain amino acid transport system ATP-binding protein